MERARALVPSLRQRAPEAERLRRMPAATVEDFRRAGFYRVHQPARHGGFEMPFGTHTEYSMELARGRASSASRAMARSPVRGSRPRRRSSSGSRNPRPKSMPLDS